MGEERELVLRELGKFDHEKETQNIGKTVGFLFFFLKDFLKKTWQDCAYLMEEKVPREEKDKIFWRMLRGGG